MEVIDHVKIAREELEKLRKRHGGVSSYGCVSLDGEVFTYLNGACHSMCQTHMSNHKAHLIFSITGYSKESIPPLTDEERCLYLAWLCSEDSPYAPVLHNQYNNDAEYVANNGVIIDNLAAPRNLMVGAFAASRACFEHPPHVQMFCKLVKSGVKARFAFFLAGMATEDKQGNVYYGMRSNTNHWPIWTFDADEEYVTNLLSGKHRGDQPFNVYAYTQKTMSVGGAWFSNEGECQFPSPNSGPVKEKYITKFKNKAKTVLESSGFTPMSYSKFDSFLKTALQEQERLYAKAAA